MTDEPGEVIALGDDALGLLLNRLVRVGGLLQPDRPLLGHPVSVSEAFALAELAAAAPLSQRDLGERLNLEKSTVSRLVAGLDRRGLVTRRRDPDNRRYYRLELTAAGRTAVRALAEEMASRHARIFAAMTERERDALATGVCALLRAMASLAPTGPGPHEGPHG